MYRAATRIIRAAVARPAGILTASASGHTLPTWLTQSQYFFFKCRCALRQLLPQPIEFLYYADRLLYAHARPLPLLHVAGFISCVFIIAARRLVKTQ